jgi:hypothetical protein
MKTYEQAQAELTCERDPHHTPTAYNIGGLTKRDLWDALRAVENYDVALYGRVAGVYFNEHAAVGEQWLLGGAVYRHGSGDNPITLPSWTAGFKYFTKPVAPKYIYSEGGGRVDSADAVKFLLGRIAATDDRVHELRQMVDRLRTEVDAARRLSKKPAAPRKKK